MKSAIRTGITWCFCASTVSGAYPGLLQVREDLVNGFESVIQVFCRATATEELVTVRVLDDVDSSNVMIIAPTNLTTSYFLTHHAFTAIPVDSLSTAVRTQIDAALDVRVDTFELIQIGKWNSDSANHSLAEFTDA